MPPPKKPPPVRVVVVTAPRPEKLIFLTFWNGTMIVFSRVPSITKTKSLLNSIVHSPEVRPDNLSVLKMAPLTSVRPGNTAHASALSGSTPIRI